MHREQHRRPVEEDDRERVERVVEQVPVSEREVVGPIEVAEDPVRHRLRPIAQQHRTDEAQHQEQPDRRGEGPGNVHPHAQSLGPHVGAHPPAKDRYGQERARQDEPAALFKRNEEAEAVFRTGRVEREPEELAHEALRAPAHLGPEVEADDHDRDPAKAQRKRAQQAEIDRADLGLAQLAHPVVVAGQGDPPIAAVEVRDAHFGRPLHLHLREDVLISRHGSGAPYDQIGIFFQKSQNSIQLPTYRVPEMTMQMALQNAALSARKSPTR